MADCPAWDSFIDATFPGDAQSVAFEIPAWAMTPDSSIQKSLLLVGEGSNGKSVFLAALRAFLGSRNVSGVSLHKMEADKFSVSRLVGKLANICPDIPNKKLAGTSIFKALTGGDAVHAERKYRDSFEFIPYAKLIFSANQPPPSDDPTFAFLRRWLVLPFTRTFEEGGRDTLKRSELDAMLADPRELSGVLNRALSVLPKLREQAFSVSPSMTSALLEFQRIADPFQVWLDRYTVPDPTGAVVIRQLIDRYTVDCTSAHRTPMTDTAFGRALRRARPEAKVARVGGQQVYRGIAWKPMAL
jgi:putative DNA primase/helicase